MRKQAWCKLVGGVILLSAATTRLAGQTFTVVIPFSSKSGGSPDHMPFVEGIDGDLYGTTSGHGGAILAHPCGTVFKTTTQGTQTTFYSFGCADDGGFPEGGLIQASDGSFYGTTSSFGVNGGGTIFRLTNGILTTIHQFSGADGSNPQGGLIEAGVSNLYGSTVSGGANGYGTVYRLAGGVLTALHSFTSSDGANPYGSLVRVLGSFYGTTYAGGANGYGTVFKMNGAGVVTTLHSFSSSDGANPAAGLLLATDGNLYGTTEYGGTANYGTVFKITPAGVFTVLHNFIGVDGTNPTAALIEATDGNFYGTTEFGGLYNIVTEGNGTIFEITPGGTLTTLVALGGFLQGFNVAGGLVQATDGNLYGTTDLEGADGWGTAYQLSVGLAPFVKALPDAGMVGATIAIMGSDLTGATAVSFNGAAAAFNVLSATMIAAPVPAGATSGKIRVTTPSGTFSSALPFFVLP